MTHQLKWREEGKKGDGKRNSVRREKEINTTLSRAEGMGGRREGRRTRSTTPETRTVAFSPCRRPPAPPVTATPRPPPPTDTLPHPTTVASALPPSLPPSPSTLPSPPTRAKRLLPPRVALPLPPTPRPPPPFPRPQARLGYEKDVRRAGR